MALQFLRGNPQAPKGHAIFVAHSRGGSTGFQLSSQRGAQTVYSTYCLVPPIPMSIAKYLPPLFAAQIPSEELQGAASIAGMPIPPMLEEGMSLDQLRNLAERRDDDLCDLGSVSSEEVERMQMATVSCQEYAQLYASFIAQAGSLPVNSSATSSGSSAEIADMDAEDLFVQTMTDRQKLAEVGKLVGMARYALEGNDKTLLQDTKQRIDRIVHHLPEKYRGTELASAAISPGTQSARLAELYLSRAYKLLDEEYAEIPAIESEIRKLKE
jgi:pimeloyl-ACP methyl ester carboxylesterase